MFGSLSIDEFLRDYWQKKPLLIRQAIPGFRSPLRPEELAGLSCEEGVESRLILEKGGKYPWELRFGPFSERDFRRLPASHWTLLVQEADRLVPEVGALLDHFRFAPDWRIDDIMISYAPDHGGVGAHIDNYDVFLLQGLGKRQWQIDTSPVDEEVLIEDLDVSILAEFEPDEEWVLEPGDMLYLPPRIAHYGVAIGDCMTYSVGFRAPSDEEVLSGFLASYVTEIDPTKRYSDPDLTPAEHAGEISDDALAYVRDVIRRAADDTAAIDRWFGRFITEPRRGFYPEPVDEAEMVAGMDIRRALEAGRTISRVPGVRFAFERRSNGWISLFVAGEEYELDEELAPVGIQVADRPSVRAEDLPDNPSRDAYELLADLINQGFCEIE